MEVDPAEFRNGEEARRNDLTVSDDNDAIGSQLLQKRLGFGCPNLFRLMHYKLGRLRRFFDRRGRNFLAAPARPVRLRNRSKNFKVRLCEEMFKRRNRKRRRATENNSHHQFTAAAKRPTPPLTTGPVS